MICSKCGKEINNNAKFCKFCGAEIRHQIKEINDEKFETMVIPSIKSDEITKTDISSKSFQSSQPTISAQQVFANAPKRPAASVNVPREPFNAGAPVYDFDDNRNVKKNVPPSQKNKTADKKSKSQKQKIILSVIAVLLVVAIALTGILIYKKLTTTDEEKLRAILAKQTSKPVVEILCKDYDENDTYEAYAVVSGVSKEGDKEFKEADIYFVSEDGAKLIQQNVDGKTTGIISTEKRLYVTYEITMNNGKTLSYIYTADGVKPAESEISGKYSQVRQEGGKIKGIDVTGTLIDINMTDKITDVFVVNNNKNQSNKTETPITPPEELTTEPPEVDNYTSNLETYKKYFASGGLNDIPANYDSPDEVVVETCMIDMNDDKTYELLVFVKDSYSETFSAVFAIQNDGVKLLHEAYSGGSGGGSFHSIFKEVSTGKHFIMSRAFVKDGYRAGDGYVAVLTYDGTSITESKDFESGSFEIDYYDYFDNLKKETTVYSVEENRVYWFKVAGEYVTETEYDTEYSRYSETVSPEYEPKQGTYSNPMPY